MTRNGEAPMPATETSGEIRAELYVRETLPTPARQCSQRIVARLERLAADGLLGEFSVSSWAKRLAIEGSAHPSQRTRYNEFSDWARRNGVRLTPFFDTRECYSMQTGEKRTELVFPAICLAIYEDGELQTVTPHASGETTTTVADSLDRLRKEPTEEPSQQTTLTAD